MIYILSGPIRSGKSTALKEWISDQSMDAGGFLTPDVDGRRKILDILTGNLYNLELSDTISENELIVGRFRFDALLFEKAAKWTVTQVKSGLKWIVVDEIGKLEMIDSGFDKLVRELLLLKQEDQNYIFVVRDYLVEDVIKKYGLQQAVLIDNQKLRLLRS